MLVSSAVRLGVAALAIGMLAGTGARAHSWYPIECCQGKDCMRVDRIEQTADGGMLMFAGSLQVRVPRGFTQRPSRDNDAHVCVRPNGDGSFAPRCVFIPAGV